MGEEVEKATFTEGYLFFRPPQQHDSSVYESV
jgi:hypothetical protein